MKRLPVARIRTACGCAAILACLAAARSPAPVPVRPQITADPNDPEKTRTIIPREEREKLGLTPRTWAGVIQPEAYTTLDRLNKTVEGLKNTNTVQAVQRLHSVRFEGTVYVQIQLKPDSKTKDVQQRVLADLRASELHLPCLFLESPGLTAYVTKAGLDKLAKDPDVTGVCLDDKPLPGAGTIIVKDVLPPAKPGEAMSEPGVPEKKVDPDVYRALALNDRVDVLISLRNDSLPPLTDVPSEMHLRNRLRKEAEKQLQDKVLSSVSADEFWLSSRLGSGLVGRISKQGLQKLWKHPDLRRIYLPEMRKIPERNLRAR